MEKRRLRVIKWLGTIPAVGTCTSCNREFKVPMTALLEPEWAAGEILLLRDATDLVVEGIVDGHVSVQLNS